MTKGLAALDGWLHTGEWPRVTCPVCGVGTVHPEHFAPYPDRISTRLLDRQRQVGGPRPELEGTFSGSLECDDTDCRQRFATSGDWRDGRDGGEAYLVRHIEPPLSIMEVPGSAPPKVRGAITAASSVLWISPGAAASELRQAVDHLLTTKRIPRTEAVGWKRVYLPLPIRLREFKAVEPGIATALQRVRWIGDGHHDGGLTATEILADAHVLESALQSLYGKR
jgi:hypothetical protein